MRFWRPKTYHNKIYIKRFAGFGLPMILAVFGGRGAISALKPLGVGFSAPARLCPDFAPFLPLKLLRPYQGKNFCRSRQSAHPMASARTTVFPAERICPCKPKPALPFIEFFHIFILQWHTCSEGKFYCSSVLQIFGWTIEIPFIERCPPRLLHNSYTSSAASLRVCFFEQ